jgi:hypothetical protein
MFYRNALLGVLGLAVISCSSAPVREECHYGTSFRREAVICPSGSYTLKGDFIVPLREQSKARDIFGDRIHLLWDVVGTQQRRLCVSMRGEYSDYDVGEADLTCSLRRYLAAVSPKSDAELFLFRNLGYVGVNGGEEVSACLNLDDKLMPELVAAIENDLVPY